MMMMNFFSWTLEMLRIVTACLSFAQHRYFINTTATHKSSQFFERKPIMCNILRQFFNFIYQITSLPTPSSSMASPTTVRNDKLAGNWLEKKWLAKTIPSFFAVSKIALKWRPITPTFYLLAGVELEDVYQMTCGSNIELQNTMVCLQRYTCFV